MPESFEAWWGKLGPFTKGSLVISAVLTIAMTFGIVSPYYYIVDFESLFWKLHLWRPVTSCLFLGKLGFPFLMNLAMLVMYTANNEEEFAGRPADFAWLITVVVFVLHLVGGFLLGAPILSFGYIMALVWIFCKRHEEAQLSIYMFSFKASFFPWALMLFHLCLGMSIVDDLVGIVAGHTYIFFTDILPKTHGLNLLPTPRFYYSWLPNQRLMPRGVDVHIPAARAGGANQQPQQHRWGGGRTLGAN
jgi:hypothetical protein